MGTKFMFRTTDLEWDAAGGTNYVDVGDLRSIMPLEVTREMVDVTHSESPAYREFIAQSFRDGGTMTATIFLDKTDYNALKTELDTETAAAWRISFPLVGAEATPSRITFSGWIIRLGIPERNTDDGDAWMTDLEVKLTGAATFTPGT